MYVLHVKLIMLHVDINKSHIDIIILHVGAEVWHHRRGYLDVNFDNTISSNNGESTIIMDLSIHKVVFFNTTSLFGSKPFFIIFHIN